MTQCIQTLANHATELATIAQLTHDSPDRNGSIAYRFGRFESGDAILFYINVV